jgi:hypothetical protein
MTVLVYLENSTKNSLRVAVGKVVTLDAAPRRATYDGRLNKAPDGRLVRPSPGELNLVELNPAEIVELELTIVPTAKGIKEYTIVYQITEDLGTLAGCWAGRITTSFTVPRGFEGHSGPP